MVYPMRSDGMLAFVVDEHAVNSGLRVLLMTEPGERLNEPDVGVALRGMLFDPGSPGIQDEVVRRISAAIERFEPRIIVVPPGIKAEVLEESGLAPTGAVYLGVSFKWAFKKDLSTKLDFSTTLFRRDPNARQTFNNTTT